MARSPLTETINRVQGMMTYVRENLSTDEYMLFLDLLALEPEPEQITTKKPKKRKAGKSARAASLASQVNHHAQLGIAAPTPTRGLVFTGLQGMAASSAAVPKIARYTIRQVVTVGIISLWPTRQPPPPKTTTTTTIRSR